MNQFQNDILTIINNVLNGQDNKVSAQFSYEECFEFAKMQQLQVMLFEGLKAMKILKIRLCFQILAWSVRNLLVIALCKIMK